MSSYYSIRGKIGLICPEDNTVMEPEMNRIVLPENVSVHSVRFRGMGGAEAEWPDEKTLGKIVGAAELLNYVLSEWNQAGTVISYIMEGATVKKGMWWDKEIVKRIKQKINIPATTSWLSTFKALDELKAKKVAFICYGPFYCDSMTKFLEDNGVEVTKVVDMGYDTSLEAYVKAQWASHDVYYRKAKEVDTSDADCIFFASNIHAIIDIVDRLEADLGKPVISTNMCTTWNTLRTIGVHKPIEGYGTLLRNL